MIRARSLRPWLLAALALVGPAASAHAALSVTVLNSTATAGGTGSFDVTIASNSGAFNVSGFSLELQVAANSGILFTAANTNTASPYLFGTLQQPPFTTTTFPTTDIKVSDSDFAAPYYVTVSPTSGTFGLAHVTYSVAAGATPGPITVSFLGTTGTNRTTEVDDINANPFAITTTNGTITILPSASVPEPASALLVALGLAGTAGVAARRARRRP